MEDRISKEVQDFIDCLLELNRQIVGLFQTSDLTLFTKINKTIKEMYRIQNGSEEEALVAAEEECRIIYTNFDMIVKVLRTTENGEIDRGAETAINRFLHNIHEATVNIAAMYGLI